jgi:adenylate cyclase class 2
MNKLVALECVFSSPKMQDDMVWVEKTGSLDVFLSNSVFVRIRIQDGSKVILTAKRSKEKTGAASLVKREHEVVVDSAEEVRGILQLMGLQEAVRVTKTRQTTTCNGYEVCIDDFEGLGSFIELEKIASTDKAADIQDEMMKFLETLGIAPENRIMKGYDILMLEKTV